MPKIKRALAAICASAMVIGQASLFPCAAVVSAGNVTVSEPFEDPDLIMRYDSQAGTYSKDNAFDNSESFYRALPLGNGRIGAMVYGNCPTEWIDLNECTVWSAGPGSNDREGAANYLKEVQDLLAAGKYKEANDIIGSKMIGGGQAKYQKVGMLKIATGHDKVGDYSRQLDLNTGVTTTSYIFNGKRYTRESFVSNPDQVMVTRITCQDSGSVSFSAGYDGLLNGSVSVEGDTVTATGHGDDDCWTRGAVYYCARTKVIPDGGSLSSGDGRINVEGANSVMLVTAIRTNFIDSQTCNGDEKGDSAKDLRKVAGMSYDELYSRHKEDFTSLMGRVDLDLGGDSSAAASKTVETRISDFSKNHDPKMVKLLYQYGRYLMISGSRGAQAMNLQGIWNKYTNPAWGSKSTTNINYEMNYWPALTTNLPECFVPFVEKAKALTVNGSKTAKVQYGIDEGWVLHHNTDIWNRTGPIDGQWGLWPTGGAWISNMLYDAYRFNQNDSYLADIYPVIKGSSAFLNKLMIPQKIGDQTYMVISPSASPELPLPGYAWDDNVYCSYSVTMDNAICRELFQDTAQAASQLGVDDSFRSEIEDKLDMIKPPAAGKYGQLMEWAYDWDNPRETHRHISHIYGLFPGNEYSPSTNSEISAAARQALVNRGDAGTGWSEAWKLNCWARLEDGEHAYDLVKLLISPVNGTESGRLYANLWDAHPPFQIDGNFGFTSGVTEMLLQSQNNEISLLPAIPSDWSTGHVSGLCARGNFEIQDMKWDGGRLTGVTILSKSGGVCTVRNGSRRVCFLTEKGKSYHLDGRLKVAEKVQLIGNVAPNGKASGNASAAVDGSASTAWEESKGANSYAVTVDMGKATDIYKWGVRFGGENYNARNMTFYYSSDGENWKAADELSGNTKTCFCRTVPKINARYFRLEMLLPTQDNSGGVKLCEFELYGETESRITGVSPYKAPIEAENSDLLLGGIRIENNDTYSDIGYIKSGSAFAVYDLDFFLGAADFKIRASSAADGGTVEIHLGSETGPVIGECSISPTEDWADYKDFTCKLDSCTGLQDVFIVCKGDDGYLFNVDSISFTPLYGDVNSDEEFSIADVVSLQKWLIRSPGAKLRNWQAADLNADEKLNVFDLILLKRALMRI